MTRKYALVTKEGTACSETVLTECEYTQEKRTMIEAQFCGEGDDDPQRDTWTEVSENDAL